MAKDMTGRAGRSAKRKYEGALNQLTMVDDWLSSDRKLLVSALYDGALQVSDLAVYAMARLFEIQRVEKRQYNLLRSPCHLTEPAYGRYWAGGTGFAEAFLRRALSRLRAVGLMDVEQSLLDRPSLSVSLRGELLRKHPACQKCGGVDRLEIDHVHPYSKGGSSQRYNLQVLCKKCNLKKGIKVA